MCIYDKGKQLGLSDELYRIEYRLTGKYLKRQSTKSGVRKSYNMFNIDSFDCGEVKFILNIEKYLGCLSNKHLIFDKELCKY